MSVLFGLIALLWILALVAARAMEHDSSQRLDVPESARPEHPLPAVDVVVPARDEAGNIAALLESLLALDHPPARIFVVDDQSTDGTGTIVETFSARDPRVVRIAGNGPPAGWQGKPAALVAGYAMTSAPWVLFVDADVRLAPATLRAALEEALRRHWQGISLWGRWIVPSTTARWLQSVVGGFIRGAHPLPRVNDPAKPDAFLNGQFLLIDRAGYDTLGGWTSVKDAFGMEDVALARLAKSKRVPIGLLRAPELMSVVPYRALGEVWRGYLKNFVDGAGGTGRSLGAALAIFIAAVLPFLTLLIALVGATTRLLRLGTSGEEGTMVVAAVLGDPRFLAATLACVAAVAFRVGTARLFHHPRRDAFAHPIANGMFVALILEAVWLKSQGKSAAWKGRGSSKA